MRKILFNINDVKKDIIISSYEY